MRAGRAVRGQARRARRRWGLFHSVVVVLATVGWAAAVSAQSASGFERQRLSETFTSEGASFADLDSDGHGDVIAGPMLDQALAQVELLLPVCL